jgi:MFS transporter, MHS family, alpha-ketoglutarate permease
MGGSVAFYTFTTYMQKFLVATAGMSKNGATLLNAATLVVFMLMQPVLGALSDRVGRRPILIGFGLAGTLFTVPLMSALAEVSTWWEGFILVSAALLIVSGYTSVNAVVKAELFPSHIRALGVGLPYAISVGVRRLGGIRRATAQGLGL